MGLSVLLCIAAHKEATQPQFLCEVLHRPTKPEKQGTICITTTEKLQRPLLEYISTQKQILK